MIVIFFAGCSFSPKFLLDDQYYNQWEYIEINAHDFEWLNTQNYILFVYNSYCAFSIPCDQIFKEFMEKYHIDFLAMHYDEFKDTALHSTVRFAPSVIVVKNWKIVDYLNPEKDEYLDLYQDEIAFEKWISSYIILTK
jgi:thiol-disulfide isomerase/thioredoxin